MFRFAPVKLNELMIRHPKRFSGSTNWPRLLEKQANGQQANWQAGKDELNAGLKPERGPN